MKHFIPFALSIFTLIFFNTNLSAQFGGNGPVTTFDDVGIGISNPEVALHVKGSPAIRVGSQTGPGEGTFFCSTLNGLSTLNIVGKDLLRLGTGTEFGSANSSFAITITDDNKVGIGTSFPDESLDVNGNVEISQDLQVNSQIFISNNGLLESSTGRMELYGKSSLILGTNSTLDAATANDIVYITSNDRVGIGVSSPSQDLDVDGAIEIGTTTSNTTGAIRYNGTNFQGHSNGVWKNLDEAGSAPVWSQSGVNALYSTGQVGIGTSSPNSRLHVDANVGEDIFRLQSAGSTKFFVSSNFGTAIGAFQTPPSAGLYVHGNTGIGTVNPLEKLDVNGAIRIGTTTGTISGTIRYNGTNFQGRHNGVWKNLDEIGGTSVWSQSGSNAHYTLGRVGIGTNNPNSTLHIDGLSGQNPLRAAIAGQTKFHVSSNGGVSIGTPSAPPGNGLAVSGNVGIGTTAAAQKLTVIGDASISGSLVAPSDRRLKENIVPLENALKIISQLQPKTYTYLEEKSVEFGLSENMEYGLIAQDLEEVLPTLVLNNALMSENGESYKGVEYEQLIPILTQAIKELVDRNEVLLDENRELKSEQDAIESRVAKIEALLQNN